MFALGSLYDLIWLPKVHIAAWIMVVTLSNIMKNIKLKLFDHCSVLCLGNRIYQLVCIVEYVFLWLSFRDFKEEGWSGSLDLYM